jgi:hypothetical protein
MGTPQAGARPMRDIDVIIKARDEVEELLHAYMQPGPRNAEESMQRLIAILDRQDLVAALERLRQGYGPRVVK